MARHSFVWVRVHLVWSTYRRRPWLAPEWRDRLYRYLAAVARRKGALPLCIGGARDHIHVYVSLGPDTSVGRLVNALKANSCRWIHETFPRFRLFAWQTGYAAFSVSERFEQSVISYISTQEAHHRREGFQRELQRLMTRHGSHSPVRKHGAPPRVPTMTGPSPVRQHGPTSMQPRGAISPCALPGGHARVCNDGAYREATP